MKHTPGPWKRQFAITGTGKQIVTINSPKQPEGGYFEICRQYIEGEPQESIERIKADFAILAAAPELLEALEKVTNTLEDKLYDDAVETWATKDVAQKHAAALVQEYRDIIAKAKAS